MVGVAFELPVEPFHECCAMCGSCKQAIALPSQPAPTKRKPLLARVLRAGSLIQGAHYSTCADTPCAALSPLKVNVTSCRRLVNPSSCPSQRCDRAGRPTMLHTLLSSPSGALQSHRPFLGGAPIVSAAPRCTASIASRQQTCASASPSARESCLTTFSEFCSSCMVWKQCRRTQPEPHQVTQFSHA